MTLPFVTAEFRVPEVHLPSVHVPQPNLPSARVKSVHLPRPTVPHLPGPDLTEAARVVAAHLPPRQQITHAARRGAGAVVGLIEWPAAASVAAVRSYLAKRAGSGRPSRPRAVRKPTT